MAKETPPTKPPGGGSPGSDGPPTTPGPPAHVDPPQPGHIPKPPVVDPDATDPTAVKTTADGRKVGWQQPAQPKSDNDAKYCAHIGKAIARMSIRQHEIGDEWVCTCGQTFEVVWGAGGNKILMKKAEDE